MSTTTTTTKRISVDSAIGSIRKGHVVSVVLIALLIGFVSSLAAHLVTEMIDPETSHRKRIVIQWVVLAAAVLALSIALCMTVR
jgi:H+/Cl- antiporter ClcA